MVDVKDNVRYEGYSLQDALGAVGKGWGPLLSVVFEKKPDIINIVQVKEKFGGLRIYTDVFDEAFEEVIRWAEIEADKTCEWCGKPGTSDNRYYWLLTLCTACKRKRKREKNANTARNI